MTYLKVAYGAIKRYQIEAPYRAMYFKRFPGRKRSVSFGVLVQKLVGAGMVTRKEMRPLQKKYETYSNLLHGNH